MEKNKTLNNFKWEVISENDVAKFIWKYNSKISSINPYEVEVKYKSNELPVGKKVKRTKL
jgi:hypothetical protein|tara:strand:+ start:240 stop:419 length:180 start_codon:yes stop_codon:yes gene_type:complete